MTPSSQQFDICVVGHLTNDTIRFANGESKRQPGGVPTYAPNLLAAAGLRTAVVTRGDGEALVRAQAEADGSTAYFWEADASTTEFVNAYSDMPEERVQHVHERAGSIGAEMIAGIDTVAWLFGPLLGDDIEPSAYHAAASRGIVALDLQGLCRSLDGTRVIARAAPHLGAVLAEAKIVKASRYEAETATGESKPKAAIRKLLRQGVAEVLVTDAGAGLWIGTKREIRHVSAPPLARLVDTTGCGDTLLAAYVLMRLRGAKPLAAAEAGARAATAKAGQRGPLRQLPDVEPRRTEAESRAAATP